MTPDDIQRLEQRRIREREHSREQKSCGRPILAGPDGEDPWEAMRFQAELVQIKKNAFEECAL